MAVDCIKKGTNRTACPICDGDWFQVLFETSVRDKYEVSIVQCYGCQFVFHNPILEQELLQQFIFEEYYNSKNYGSGIDRRFAHHFIRRADTHWRLLKLYWPSSRRRKVLDVGCGAGFFLHTIRNKGWDCYGIEPDERCFKHASSQLNLNVERTLFEHYQAEAEFDLIYFSHIFDDLPEIGAVLSKVRDLLVPNGKVFIEVPNLSVNRNFEKMDDGDLIENKYYFTIHTIAELLRKHQFSIDYLKTAEPVYLNTIGQYFKSPFNALKKLRPADKKSHIRVVATPFQ